MKFIKLLMAALLLINPPMTLAGQRVSGHFEAALTCPAYSSFRHLRNPADITLQPGKQYPAFEVNATDWSWIRVEVKGAEPRRRWVSRSCGDADIVFGQVGDQTGKLRCHDTPIPNSCNVPNLHDSNVLALSWLPGFCEYAYNPASGKKKKECDLLNSGAITVTHLTLHGLWPNKTECLTCYGKCEGEALQLRDETAQKLSHWMPSYRYGDGLARHEWSKHGTCQSLDDDDYFDTALHFLKQVDQSPIGEYLHTNTGRDVEVNNFKTFIVQKIGAEAASRIELSCTGKRKRYLQELRLKLPRDLNRQDDNLLPTLLRGPIAGHFRGNCPTVIHIEAPGR